MNNKQTVYKIKLPKFFLFLAFLLTFSFHAYCQNGSTSVQSDAMRSYMKQYQEFTNSNKNAQALEVLQKYAILQELALNRERDSSLRKIQNDFLVAQKGRRDEIQQKEQTIAELKEANEDIDRENIKMTRNTLLFFGILIGLAVLILLNRFRALAAVKEQYQLSNSYLKYAESFAGSSETDRNEVQKINHNLQAVLKHVNDADALVSKLVNDKQHPVNKQTSQLIQNIHKASSLLQPIQSEEPGTKKSTDLNQLIDEVTDQAYYYFSSEAPEFQCAISRDLEKILPKIEIIPEDIRLVIFNLLMNAFDSINEKRSNAPKGYQPKVTISTRKLPRFVQIRIKDNGTGISEKDPKQLLEPFYTKKKSEKNPGLGLSECARIINVVHKGELLIESDSGNGSDFIIRFTTLTLM